MKLNYFKSISLLFTFIFCVANPARAALVTTEFSELVGNQGTVDINLSLSAGENFSGFSLYFSEQLFADLNIILSPEEWDSIVLQPDAVLGAGLFDSYNPAGLSSGFARISFTYLSNLPFETLAYDFYDANFVILASGSSTNVTTPDVITPVPESSTIILLMLGLMALGLRKRHVNTLFHCTTFHPTNPQQVAA